MKKIKILAITLVLMLVLPTAIMAFDWPPIPIVDLMGDNEQQGIFLSKTSLHIVSDTEIIIDDNNAGAWVNGIDLGNRWIVSGRIQIEAGNAFFALGYYAPDVGDGFAALRMTNINVDWDMTDNKITRFSSAQMDNTFAWSEWEEETGEWIIGEEGYDFKIYRIFGENFVHVRIYNATTGAEICHYQTCTYDDYYADLIQYVGLMANGTVRYSNIDIRANTHPDTVLNPPQPEPEPEQPVADQPAAEQPVADQPAAEQPVADQPAAEQPVADQPVQADKPSAPRVGDTATIMLALIACAGLAGITVYRKRISVK